MAVNINEVSRHSFSLSDSGTFRMCTHPHAVVFCTGDTNEKELPWVGINPTTICIVSLASTYEHVCTYYNVCMSLALNQVGAEDEREVLCLLQWV